MWFNGYTQPKDLCNVNYLGKCVKWTSFHSFLARCPFVLPSSSPTYRPYCRCVETQLVDTITVIWLLWRVTNLLQPPKVSADCQTHGSEALCATRGSEQQRPPLQLARRRHRGTIKGTSALTEVCVSPNICFGWNAAATRSQRSWEPDQVWARKGCGELELIPAVNLGDKRVRPGLKH